MLLEVQAAGTVSANMNAAAGVSPIKAPFAAIGSAGMTADYLGTFFTRSISISSGQSVDYIFGSPLPGPITEDNIQILGPAFLHPGSLRGGCSGRRTAQR